MYEALAYFASKVRFAGQVKLYKLLYYLDLLHFRRTGQTVTGLTYEAWPMGPVPAALDREFGDKASTLHERFEVQKYRRVQEYDAPTVDSTEEDVERNGARSTHLPGSLKPRQQYRHQYLSRREMKLADLLAEIFQDATAAQMSDVSHSKFGPWRKALRRGSEQGAKGPVIDLLEGVVACGNAKEELPPDELREAVAERARIDEILG